MVFSIQLFAALDAKDAYVVVLTTQPTSSYTSEVPVSDMQVPFLRGLKSSKFAGSPLCNILEQPNLVVGLAAQSECVLYRIIKIAESFLP